MRNRLSSRYHIYQKELNGIRGYDAASPSGLHSMRPAIRCLLIRTFGPEHRGLILFRNGIIFEYGDFAAVVLRKDRETAILASCLNDIRKGRSSPRESSD